MEKTPREFRSLQARLPARVLLACMAAFSGLVPSKARQADIVYACDQSGSMFLNYIRISPDGPDTVYLSGMAGCPSYTTNDRSGFGSVTVPNDMGTRRSIRRPMSRLS